MHVPSTVWWLNHIDSWVYCDHQKRRKKKAHKCHFLLVMYFRIPFPVSLLNLSVPIGSYKHPLCSCHTSVLFYLLQIRISPTLPASSAKLFSYRVSLRSHVPMLVPMQKGVITWLVKSNADCRNTLGSHFIWTRGVWITEMYKQKKSRVLSI